VSVLGYAGVPVGNVVEVRWYRREKKGLLGALDTFEHDEMPIVVDLDTGVWFGSEWHFVPGRIKHDGLNDARFEVRDSLRVIRVLRGRVRACRVITMTSVRGRIQTLLSIAVEDDDGPPYRT